LIVKNTIQPKISTEPSSKIGLKNIDERYLLITGKGIRVEQKHQEFVVHLPLVTVEKYAGFNH
jgi:two-component system, LytTR family, sensor kinase